MVGGSVRQFGVGISSGGSQPPHDRSRPHLFAADKTTIAEVDQSIIGGLLCDANLVCELYGSENRVRMHKHRSEVSFITVLHLRVSHDLRILVTGQKLRWLTVTCLESTVTKQLNTQHLYWPSNGTIIRTYAVANQSGNAGATKKRRPATGPVNTHEAMLENNPDADKTTGASSASHTLTRLIEWFERVDWTRIHGITALEAAQMADRLRDAHPESMPDQYLSNLRVTYSTLDRLDTPTAEEAMAEVHAEIERLEATSQDGADK